MTRRAICRAARAHEPCTVCHATPGHPCPGGTHLCRIGAAARDRHITMRDFAHLTSGTGVFTGTSLVLDEVTA